VHRPLPPEDEAPERVLPGFVAAAAHRIEPATYAAPAGNATRTRSTGKTPAALSGPATSASRSRHEQAFSKEIHAASPSPSCNWTSARSR
jgi:hypothetical protein